ncbi:MAG: GGDEF domain-containing protein [Kangiellaceae bacterium]|nr:GGDEF domain-containing protein [Kangiellaceae bacterium]
MLSASESNNLQVDIARFEQELQTYKSSQDALKFLSKYEKQVEGWSSPNKARFLYLRGFQKEGVSDFEGAISDYTQAIDLSDTSNPDDTLIESLLDRSYVIYLQTFDTSDYCPDRKLAVNYSKNITNNDLRAKALTQYAFCFRDSDNFKQGLVLLEEAMTLANNSDLSLNRKAMIHNATGELYSHNYLFEYAYEHIKHAYELWSQANDYQDMFNMLHTLVGLSNQLAHWEVAEKYLAELHLLADTQTEFKDFKFFAFFNEGRLRFSQKQFAEAEFALKQALSLKDTTPEKFFVRRSYTYLAISLARLDRTEEAHEYIHQAMATEEKISKPLAYALKAVDAIHHGEVFQSTEYLFKKSDEEIKVLRKRINNQAVYLLLEHRANRAVFENKLLENELAINQLKLNNELSKNENATQRLTISILVVLILVFFSLFMYKSRKVFKHRAHTDALTGIANRRYCFEQSEKHFKKCSSKRQPISVLIFDIDHFKKINDNYGHKTGDEAIRMVAHQAEHWLKSGDVLGRIGGEEFLVVLPNTGLDEAEQVAERLRNGIANKVFERSSDKINLTVSIGVSSVSEDTESLYQLINIADKALYSAKQSGRNKTCLAE